MQLYIVFFQLNFMNEKIKQQFLLAALQDRSDISNTRFGSLVMDLQYIESQPLSGNGLAIKTRFRFHPQITQDIGHGNGMSNFLASWGIPFFLFWLYRFFQFSQNTSNSIQTSFIVLFILILVLQGEQFLNYPILLTFFVFPFATQIIVNDFDKSLNDYENSLDNE